MIQFINQNVVPLPIVSLLLLSISISIPLLANIHNKMVLCCVENQQKRTIDTLSSSARPFRVENIQLRESPKTDTENHNYVGSMM